MFEFMGAFILAGEAAVFLIPAAAQSRGCYGTLGGEWFLIVLAAIVGAYLGRAVAWAVKNFLA